LTLYRWTLPKLTASGKFRRLLQDVCHKGVSPDYLDKPGYGLGFCPVETIPD
jgi:hypothetical protein